MELVHENLVVLCTTLTEKKEAKLESKPHKYITSTLQTNIFLILTEKSSVFALYDIKTSCTIQQYFVVFFFLTKKGFQFLLCMVKSY